MIWLLVFLLLVVLYFTRTLRGAVKLSILAVSFGMSFLYLYLAWDNHNEAVRAVPRAVYNNGLTVDVFSKEALLNQAWNNLFISISLFVGSLAAVFVLKKI